MTDLDKQLIAELTRLRKQVARMETREPGSPLRWRGSAATAPSAPAEGDVWNDTSSGNVVKIYANGGWRTLN